MEEDRPLRPRGESIEGDGDDDRDLVSAISFRVANFELEAIATLAMVDPGE